MSRLQDVIQRGTRAAQPVATAVAAGTLYFVTGENVLERSSGTIWESVSAAASSLSVIGASSGYALTLISEEIEIPISIPGPVGPIGLSGLGLRGSPGIDGEDGETILIPGLQGPAGPAGSAGAGSLTIARIVLSNAQLVSLSSSPITLVAAQGADKIVIPVHFSIEVVTATSFSNNPSVSVTYNGDALNLLVSAPIPGLNQIHTVFQASYNTNFGYTYSSFDPRNKSILLKSSADLTGAGAATGVVNLSYIVIQTT